MFHEVHFFLPRPQNVYKLPLFFQPRCLGGSKGEGLEQTERRASADWALMTVENGDVESNGGFGLPSMIVLWTS